MADAAALASALEDRSYTGNILPFKTDKAGALSFAVPEMLQSLYRGGKELLNSPRAAYTTGQTTLSPEALGALAAVMGIPGLATAERAAVGIAGGRLPTASLPMDEASRMARAKQLMPAQGFHGTAHDIDGFNGATWIADDPKAASYYSDRAAARNAMDAVAEDSPFGAYDEGYGGIDDANPHDILREFPEHDVGQHVMPLRYKPGKQLDLTALGDAPDPKSLWDHLAEKGIVDHATDGDFEDNILPGLQTDSPTLWKMLEDWNLDRDIARAGYDSLRIADVVTAKGVSGGGRSYGHDAVLVFDPKNIRSRFAAFDPAKKDSANLLAASGTPAFALAPQSRRDLLAEQISKVEK